MKKILTSRQMKSCDLLTIESGVSSRVLMERAARAVFDRITKEFDPSETLVLCGSGNNGGDGLIVARLLSKAGYNSYIWYVGDGHTMTAESEELYNELIDSDIEFVCYPDMSRFTLIVDAMLGTGITFAPTGVIKCAVNEINSSGVPVVAVDIPTGISSDTGAAFGDAVIADATVSMEAYKRGHCLGDGIDASGRVYCADLGIDTENVCDHDGIFPIALTDSDLKLIPRRKRDSHKGTYGRVLVIGSKKGMCGAAYLSAAAAYKSGAGIVEIFAPEENRIPLQTLLPEALVSSYREDSFSIDQLREALFRASVVVIGPGMGTGAVALAILTEVYKSCQCPLIVDADALNLTARFNIRFPTEVPVIVTPHPGELARLCDKSVGEICSDLWSCALGFAVEHDVICVAKSARTVICDGSDMYVNMSGGPSMSKGGSGDVLTGIIAGMLCCDLSPVKAAAYGAYIHGRAGDIAASEMGDYSPMARDILDNIHKVLMLGGGYKN